MSLAYSGTTWVTLVVGSHPDALCLGGGDRAFVEGPVDPERLCVVHGRNCRFWPDFFRNYDPSESFFVQLAAYTGKRAFVINNPSEDIIKKELCRPEIRLKVVQVMRDGRASLASAMRHHPNRVQSVYQSALAWLYRGTHNLQRKLDMIGEQPLLVRYEDLATDPERTLRELSAHTGLDYDVSSLRYWEFEHHLAAGNTGTVDTLIQLQGGEGLQHDHKERYSKLIEHIRHSNGVPKLDESWRDTYDEVDLAAYDFVAGELYQGYGYPRPDVSEAARKTFVDRHAPPRSPEEAERNIPPWRRPAEQRKSKLQHFVRASPTVAAAWRVLRPWLRPMLR